MLQEKNDLEASRSRVSEVLCGVLAVILMVGLSQTACLVQALFGAAVRVAMGLLPEVLLNGLHPLHALHSTADASLCCEVVRVAGSWWPMLATLITKI